MADEKKIASEVMSDEELDQVAGGTIDQCQKDMNLMHDIGLVPQYVDHMQSDALTRAFAKAGINMVAHYNGTNQNEYFNASGKQITREQALKTVLKASGTKVNLYTGKDIVIGDYT